MFSVERAGIQSLQASRIFLVDPAAVFTTTQNRAPQEAICDRSPRDEHGPDVPNLLIWRPRLRTEDPKNITLACSHARHCGPTVRAGTIRAAHSLSIRFQINRKQETLIVKLRWRLSREPRKQFRNRCNLRCSNKRWNWG